jgi:2-polyprenyl-3-methyl-5-hydroxy-6-metoxy-1,4-benzoquinol methylase
LRAALFSSCQCRSCESSDLQLVVDLGFQPLANSFRRKDALTRMEPTYPLIVRHCRQCHLVQIPAVVAPNDIFDDYLYMSSYSPSWLEHSRAFVNLVVNRFDLHAASHVIEVGSNDGYLLQFMIKQGVRAMGIEPAANVAKLAEEKGVPTRVSFFGHATASELVAENRAADLVIANNVLAHVPDINDFVAGFAVLLKTEGVACFEFPHLANLIALAQFDTIYHEHFSYISLIAAQTLFVRHGLRIFDVEKLPTHGGSLRLYVCRENASHPASHAAAAIIAEERAAGLDRDEVYDSFAATCRRVKNEFLKFLIDAAEAGKRVCCYGAPAKGNTLLNFCGARNDYIAFTVDRNPHKQDHFLPGTGILISAPDAIVSAQPDYVVILPWNLKDEIAGQMKVIRQWGGKFVVAVPELTVF